MEIAGRGVSGVSRRLFVGFSAARDEDGRRNGGGGGGRASNARPGA
jgi:hypothetical protein